VTIAEQDGATALAREDEWLWGWDPTPGIVSVWAEHDGRALVWRRIPGLERPVREEARFRPFLLLADLGDLAHLGARLCEEGATGWDGPGVVAVRELAGPGRLRYLASTRSSRELERAVLAGAATRLGRTVARLGELDGEDVLQLPPEEQYLVATGRTYFRGLTFDDLHRLQFDLETTGLHASRDRVFLVAVRDNRGLERTLDIAEGGLEGAKAEADLIRRLAALIRERDPDVIENHNLHGFDLPFLARRAQLLGVPLALGRAGAPGLRQRPAARGYGPWRMDGPEGGAGDTATRERTGRWVVPRRLELHPSWCDVNLDFTEAVIRHDTLHVDMKMRGGSLILVTGGGMIVDADSLTTRYADISIHPPAEPDTPVRLRIHLAGRMRYGYIEAR